MIFRYSNTNKKDGGKNRIIGGGDEEIIFILKYTFNIFEKTEN